MRYTQFFTATILNWQLLLADDAVKNIIIDALRHRVQLKQVRVYGFVIMPNHVHILWFIHPDIKREDFQRDLLKYISRQIILKLKSDNRDNILNNYKVNAKDRAIQIWERNSLSIDIYSMDVFNQKLKYIHDNPLKEKWKLALYPDDYRYSSAKFYEQGVDDFGMLTNYIEDY